MIWFAAGLTAGSLATAVVLSLCMTAARADAAMPPPPEPADIDAAVRRLIDLHHDDEGPH